MLKRLVGAPFLFLVASACVSHGLIAGELAVDRREIESARAALSQALASRSPDEIGTATVTWRLLNEDLPPERAEETVPFPDSEAGISESEAQALARALWRRIEDYAWWERPNHEPQPLRVPATFIDAALNAAEITQDRRMLDRAIRAGDYLLSVQTRLGGVFGFPVPRSRLERAENQAALRFLERARAGGIRLQDIVRENWIVEDLGDGGLNFDNGLAGESLFALYEATGEQRFLAGARRAADWALTRPLVVNYNYNGFSAALLARAFAVTGERHYLDEAVERAILGVVSGQFKHGPQTGSWIDPHNRRHVYRYVMIRQLAIVYDVVPEDHPEKAAIGEALQAAVWAVEREMRLLGGLTTGDAGQAAYCVLARVGTASMAERDPDITHAVYRLMANGARRADLRAPAGVMCFLTLAPHLRW